LRESHRYYYDLLHRGFRFVVPPSKSVLYYGESVREYAPELESETVVRVDPLRTPADQSTDPALHAVAYEDYRPDRTFDHIILNGTLGETGDICRLLENIKPACTPATRVIIYQHNHLWEGILNWTARLGLKQKERVRNWLSVNDLKSILQSMGFEVVRTYRQTIFPMRFGFVGPMLNGLAAWLPIFDFFMLDQYVVVRTTGQSGKSEPGLTICITVRNEKDNIEPIVQRIPKVTAEQEILFVEGHSTDGTADEVRRVAAAYPDKNVRLLGQPGKGQGDAIRTGFAQAHGDIIILFEGDGTSDTADIAHFYRAIRDGRAEYLQGSRFIYPLGSEEMPLINKIGNIFFAKWFSLLLGQLCTDVLSGIKAIRRDRYRAVDETWGFLGIDDPFGDFELLFGASRLGLKLGELPMRYMPRTYGASKTRVFLHGAMLLRMGLRGYRVFRTLTPGRWKAS
jgi:hypothetical protein